MLDHYLEPDIIDQKVLLAILLTEKELTLESVCLQTSLTAQKVKQYFRQINALFKGYLRVELVKSNIYCEVLKDKKEGFFYDIFALSDTLKMLRFLLLDNRQNKSIATYTRQQFISQSKAYRLIHKLKAYLQTIGLDVVDNTVVGDEFRIRYLIALLHKEYGIVLYEIRPEDIETIHAFIFATQKNLKPSTFLDKRFLFFDVLLMLSWRRHNYSVSLPDLTLFEHFKTLSIFGEVKRYAMSEIETRTRVRFSLDDFDYLFLVYLTTDNSFFSGYWTPEHQEQLYRLIAEDPDYQLLMDRLQALMGKHYSITEHIPSLIPFFRRTLYNLQTLITFDGYYSDQYQGNMLLLEKVKTLIKDWLNDTGRQGNISTGHLHLMCLHLEQALENSLAPIAITIVESQETVGDVIANFITSTIPSYKIELSRVNILSDNIYHYDKLVDLIVTSQKLLPFLKELDGFAKDTCLCGLSLDGIQQQREELVKTILALRQHHYQQRLEELLAEP
ncbi:helix-turn-helix domain-containing protein [Streptococcus canis]|uniref:helix-turn-helix domain-containing protein n=1 Tax=Streptococcus canis TaxID=1329 RepID=UPI0012F0B4E9|nr:helix-turn-helix domain-containing protein [Streptococcus canis]GFE42856.1 putative regulatory protein - RofA related [Streptococcus canis]